MNNLPTTLTTSEARINIYNMMKQVGKNLRRFIITHEGKPTAVLMPIEDVESLEETNEILADKKLMRDIRQAKKDIKAGRVYSLEQVKKELGIK
ncbi:MAG: hypothetical protein UR52_C0022G0012 [Candidatus Gottesmanbacteria bacterium GW2011_GWA1_34_13]|uniref:Antitoxin n=1 Tax=Candidatus Gottesmanbacteria bacterium GW2011_GWA1_34_13 TaxID=1618434 RepID=A0A0G0D4D6_9BACT|nr:MAG: hypothetical protein UR52_C0022G0012 [Candidatus Gottesmanbacteria bacterium GW2011_GWA1_34_13]